MTTKYFAILTNQGAARLANATALGTKLNITQMAVGDGGGTLPTPDPAQTKLVNQTRIAPINSLGEAANDAGQIIAEQIIPENEGGFFIREIGLYDDDGVLIAVANCPETYKPLLAEGSGRTQTIRMILIVSSTSAITLKIDPSVVLATRKYVDDAVIEVKNYADNLMAKHLADAEPHEQYRAGRLLRVVKFELSGTYEPGQDVGGIIVEVSGGGAAGGSVGAITTGKVYAGAGGQSGAYAKSYYSRADLPDQIPVVVGAGGVSVPITSPGALNSAGGQSEFGELIICSGGMPSQGQLVTPPSVGGNASTVAEASGGNIINTGGVDGDDFFVLSTTAGSAGAGGANVMGSQVLNRVTDGPGNGSNIEGIRGVYGYGSGGSGAINTANTKQGYLGGDGAPGVVVIYEYS